jgi:hypothetical protein
MPRGVSNSNLAAKIGKKVEPVHMKHYGQEQLSIIRQSSLKAAVQFVESIMPRLDGNFTVEEFKNFTLETAETFEKWVTRDETRDNSNQ